MLTRRQFLKLSAAAGASLALSGKFAFDAPPAFAFYQSPGGIAKYATTLRGVGPSGIPVAASDGRAPQTGAIHYSLTINQYQDQILPNRPQNPLGTTTLWGYNPTRQFPDGSAPTQKHLGGIIVAQKGTPIQLTFTNNLPPKHILPVDVSTPMLGGFPDAKAKYGGNGYNAACVHLHGGFVPWISDGGPMAWFTPAASGGKYGPSVMSSAGNIYKLLNSKLQPGQAELYYPNAQSARMMWYHDHSHDITRLNAYAGLATAYIIRDTFEANLRNSGLPDFVENGGNEIPLVVQDKIFVGPNILASDPSWPGPQGVGNLWYPHIYEKSRWRYTGNVTMPDPSCIPEMFGDTMLVNGTVFPAATVQARRYRFRLLNACQARFLNLQLYIADSTPDGITYNNAGVPVNAKGPDFLVLGTEGGFLSKPVKVPSNQSFNPAMLTAGAPTMITAPAERWDMLVDFSGLAGKSVILYSDAPAPFPMGDKRNDYYAGSKNPVPTVPGFGPDTRILMRFNVVSATSNDPPLKITTDTDLTPGIDPSLVGMWTRTPLPPPAGVNVRPLTLNETFDSLGRLIQMLGPNTLNPNIPGTYGREYMDTATEVIKANTTEVWQIVNLTGDTHPIHFHLVNVQLLSRQPFDAKKFAGTPNYTGAARGPDPTELGWKETVRVNPGEVATVIMKFTLPPTPPQITIPNSPSFGNQGKEYVWHCHILEHEEHDMMRPLIIT